MSKPDLNDPLELHLAQRRCADALPLFIEATMAAYKALPEGSPAWNACRKALKAATADTHGEGE